MATCELHVCMKAGEEPRARGPSSGPGSNTAPGVRPLGNGLGEQEGPAQVVLCQVWVTCHGSSLGPVIGDVVLWCISSTVLTGGQICTFSL